MDSKPMSGMDIEFQAVIFVWPCIKSFVEDPCPLGLNETELKQLKTRSHMSDAGFCICWGYFPQESSLPGRPQIEAVTAAIDTLAVCALWERARGLGCYKPSVVEDAVSAGPKPESQRFPVLPYDLLWPQAAVCMGTAFSKRHVDSRSHVRFDSRTSYFMALRRNHP